MLKATSRDEVESLANESYSLEFPMRHYRCQVGYHVVCRPDMNDASDEEIECSDGEILVKTFRN